MRKAVRQLREVIDIAAHCGKLVRFGGRDYFSMFKRAVKVCRQRRFTPREAFLLGLYEEHEDSEVLGRYMSRRELTKLQERVNPVSWEWLLKNKGVFYRYCAVNGFDVPQLYALYFDRASGWGYRDSGTICGEAQWCEFINRQLPGEFVVKPARGAHGEGVEVFVRSNGGFVSSGGDEFDAEGVCRFMSGKGYSDGFVVQERLRNHCEIERLTGSEYLQTVRVVTFVADDGTTQVLHAHLKVTGGVNVVDNFGDGIGGNVQCMVDLESGVLGSAVMFGGGGSGIEVLERHSDTGLSFEGFELPYWTEVCDLVRRSAREFLPIRAIGWDVGITPEKAVIVEGNIWWDPHNQHKAMDKVAEALS